MISKIHIEALKSIQEMTLNCEGLNLIVGTNSAGKSTLLQAILLNAQNREEKIGLNGKLVSLGEFREARNYHMPNRNIKIEIWQSDHKEPSKMEFIGDREKDEYKIKVSADLEPRRITFLDESGGTAFRLVDPLVLHYLSCDRVGAMDIYKKNMTEGSGMGTNGEFALAYLLKHDTDSVDKDMAVQDGRTTNSLLDQVNYWLNYIVGTMLQINDLKKTNYLQVKYNNNQGNINLDAAYCRPINVGAGISYMVSVLITCLASGPNDIILIENPEIHLHPKAQSRVGEFLHHVSKAGRQLFVETHSDHIFNSIRVGVAQNKICQEDVKVYFFALDDNYETQCNPIIFGECGKITGLNHSMDIHDLFDQFEIDLDKMLGL